MRFSITSLLVLTLLVAFACTLSRKSHPQRVTEMLRYIEHDLSDALEKSPTPELPGSYVVNAIDPRGKYMELFSPIEEDYYLQSIAVVEPDFSIKELKGVAVLKWVSTGKWEYVFPIYIDDELHWQCKTPPTDPFEYRHIGSTDWSSKMFCECPDCSEKRSAK